MREEVIIRAIQLEDILVADVALVDPVPFLDPPAERLVPAETADPVVGDYLELRSAVSNLIINALKYSADDKPVLVRFLV